MFRKMLTGTIVGISALLAANLATAGEKTGLITSVHLAQQHVEKVFVKIAGAYTSEPSCSAGADGWDFMLDISQPTGKAIYVQLMAAQYGRVPVQVVGSNLCTHLNYENLSYIVVEN